MSHRYRDRYSRQFRVRASGPVEHFDHALVDRFFLAFRDLQFTLVTLGDAGNFIPDRALQSRHFRPQISGGGVIRPVTGTPLGFLVLIVEKLLPKLRDHGIAECVRDDRSRNIKALLVRPLFQNARYSVKFGPGLAGIGASLRQGYSKLIKLDFARQLAIDTNDNAVLGFEILNFLVGIARLLAQLPNSLLKPCAGATGRFKLRLQLILDVGISKGVGDLGSLVPIKGGIGDLLDVTASEAGNAQIVLNRANDAAHQFVVRRLLLRS